MARSEAETKPLCAVPSCPTALASDVCPEDTWFVAPSKEISLELGSDKCGAQHLEDFPYSYLNLNGSAGCCMARICKKSVHASTFLTLFQRPSIGVAMIVSIAALLFVPDCAV